MAGKLRYKYGIDLVDYKKMVENCQGECAICRKVPLPDARGRSLVVDHNHITGTIRGLLCIRCNLALERVEKIPDWGNKALDYLYEKIT